MKEDKCGTKPSCDPKEEKKQGDSCSTSKPGDSKQRGCGCGGKK